MEGNGRLPARPPVLVLALLLALAGCQTTPVKMGGGQPGEQPAQGKGGEQPALPTLHPLSTYTNRHGISFSCPRAWYVEDATLNYDDLDAAGAEGGAYLQIYSYDRAAVANPTAPVPERKPRS